ncbi:MULTISPECIES: DNA/RNA nuclease SfsA [Cetobacterium]|uniref:Sugar fermentation stimulation protein homolog n=1 Tax=Candidatus Cetobacterium colombiensis TaxID=3073100 RepID=A0ABU4WAE3_9FUSO|nr:DNA/RNA nuclease SfsA [Candidatus Cetobacterium colombiensis]MDX8336513.1 DNA/RNA nuclease SfsA [Candidatus Cetobacterium colombiensis]
MELIYRIDIDEIGEFIDRPNRFTANLKLKNEEIVTAHVHDSGRIKELLYPGNKVLLRKAKNIENRKTLWDVIAAYSNNEEVLINSSIHRYIIDNYLKNEKVSIFGKLDLIKPEVKYGNSRLDYLIEKNGEKIYIETKGVSLSINKIATFPDAPSIRATKHLNELIEVKKSGYRAAVILIVLKDSDFFIPNNETDPMFYKTFYKAIEAGVEIYPLLFTCKNGDIFLTNKNIKILPLK